MRKRAIHLLTGLTGLVSSVILSSCGHHCHDCNKCGHSKNCGQETYAPQAPDESHPKSGAVIVTKPVAPDSVPTTPPSVTITPPVVTPPVVPPIITVTPKTEPKSEPKAAPTTPPAATTGERKTVRIKAGTDKNWKDKDGNEWIADAGFSEGAMVDLGTVKIENSANSELYEREHIGMDKFVWTVPNGNYTVKLHFAENPEDVKKAGERVFSIDVLGEKITDLDIFKEAGGANKALMKSVKVHVTGGKIEINFKAGKKESLVNGIEIIPE